MNKKININPDFFKIGSRSALKKKKNKPIIKSKSLKPNNIKKQFIAKIKEHQKREKNKILEAKKKEETKFKNDFSESLSYLENVKKKKNKKKKTLKKQQIRRETNSQIFVSNSLVPPTNLHPSSPPVSSPKFPPSIQQNPQSINIKSPTNNINILSENLTEPPYGCLKNGSKPTFREWKNKTLKKTNDEKNIPIHINTTFDNNNFINKPSNIMFSDRQQKLKKIQQQFQRPKKKKIKIKRIKRKITLGKNGTKIGVLVKNKKTRKKIKNEITRLKKKSIQEVKNYLRQHNLIKIGSNAPPDVFRSIYENAYLSGDVKNKNVEILLHNWHKEN